MKLNHLEDKVCEIKRAVEQGTLKSKIYWYFTYVKLDCDVCDGTDRRKSCYQNERYSRKVEIREFGK